MTGSARLVAAAVLAAVALGGCGGGGSGPLGEALTDEQQVALSRAFVAPVAPPESKPGETPTSAFSREHAAAIRAACDGLDPAAPLLAAYAASCRLGAELLESADAAGPCLLDFATRCLTAHEAQAALDRRTAAAAAVLAREARAIEDRACRDEIAGTADQQRGIAELPGIADRMVAAHRARERRAFDDASGDYSDALTRVSGGADATFRDFVEEYRDACESPAEAGLDALLRRL